MIGKLAFLIAVAAGLTAAQDSSAGPAPQGVETDRPGPETRIEKAGKACSIPLLTFRPTAASRMPVIKPPDIVVSKRFFIEPPAPPCEDAERYPVLSAAEPEKKDQPQAK